MQKRLWKCDGIDCSNIREQEWEDFSLGGGWSSFVIDTGETYLDPVEVRTKAAQIVVDFCSMQCRKDFAEQRKQGSSKG